MLNQLRKAFPRMDWRQVPGALESPLMGKGRMTVTPKTRSNQPTSNGWIEPNAETRVQLYFEIKVEIPGKNTDSPWITEMDAACQDPIKAVRAFQQHLNESVRMVSLVNECLS